MFIGEAVVADAFDHYLANTSASLFHNFKQSFQHLYGTNQEYSVMIVTASEFGEV